MLISYGIVSASYIQFHKKLHLAASSLDETINQPVNFILYNRETSKYPFNSRWQPITAYYGTISCAFIVLFNGWGTLVTPVALEDFFSCYFPVRYSTVFFSQMSDKYGTILTGARSLLRC